jgi:hypothetical protein
LTTHGSEQGGAPHLALKMSRMSRRGRVGCHRSRA